MRSKVGVVAALAAMSVRIGIPDAAMAQYVEDYDERCERYELIEDRALLQQELEELLELDPDDPCVPFLLGLLGGGPVAEIPEPPY